jgi:predicted XRE-type DNA-binding protein
MSATPEHTVSSGNVFADLGLPQPDELLAKAALANQIASIIAHRHITQSQAAAILGTGQPKVSDLVAGRLDGFSIERLIRFLNALDRDVQIVVSPKPRSRESAMLRVTGRSRSARSVDVACGGA